MERQQLADDVAEALDGALSDVVPVPCANNVLGFTGTHVVGGITIELKLELDPEFPLTPPRWFLRPWDALGKIPHVLPTGFICYMSMEGTLLDRSRPIELVVESLSRCLDVLSEGVTGENRWDIVNEFEAYWGFIAPDLELRTIFHPGAQATLLQIRIDEEGNHWAARDASAFAEFNEDLPDGTRANTKAGVYLPLEERTFIEPPWPGESFWSALEFRSLVLAHLTTMDRRRLRSLRRRTTADELWIVIGIPRPSGGRSLVGMRVREIDPKSHPLSEGGAFTDATPFTVERYDHDFLVGRAGGDTGLGSRRAIVVGAGAVGSRVVTELANAGIRDITIVDNDTFRPENTHRHYLGKAYWGLNKADAMRASLRFEFPHVTATSIRRRIEKAVLVGGVDFSKFDLVVFALGNPTVELAMNEQIMSMRSGPATVFTWLDPLGIGGHALLTRPGNTGCFQCLYTASDPQSRDLNNRASFAAKNQRFGIDLTGCGSTFTPYGSADATMTAALAVKLALDGLTGRECQSTLRSWRGGAESFLERGFVLSNRYGVSEQELNGRRHDFHSSRCEVCSQYA